MALSQKQLEALSTLTGPAALDGSLSFEVVVLAVLQFCPEDRAPPRVFTDTFRGHQVVIGIADVARLLLAQRETMQGEIDEWRMRMSWLQRSDAHDLAIPPESLDGRTRPVDATERDPVEVSTFGVGSISSEAESMRFESAKDNKVLSRAQRDEEVL